MEHYVDPYFELVVGSHFFKVLNPRPRAIQILLRFYYRYAQREWKREKGGKSQMVVVRTWASKTADHTEFRFHIGQLREFLQELRYEHITPDLFITREMGVFKPQVINAVLNPDFTLREYQEETLEFILKELPNLPADAQQDLVKSILNRIKTDNNSRLIALPTGAGKTLVGCAAISRIKHRTLIPVLPSYIDKWAGDFSNNMVFKGKRIMIVQGSDQVRGLIGLAQDGKLDADYIILSLTTIQNWYKAYEEDPNGIEAQSFGCHPEELCQILKVGTVLFDEVHQHLYSIFRFLLYTNVEKVIALSATFLSNDKFIENIQKLVFPAELRYEKVKMEKYIRVYPVNYQFDDLKAAKIRTTEFGSNTYSHLAFEKSVLRNSKVTKNYLKLMDLIIKMGYIDSYQEGDKLAVFAASIAMCDVILAFLKERYPHLDIRRYVEQDPYENVIEADIRVTTVLSAGTAIDIPKLVMVLQTNNILSPVSNLQTLGRLRKIPGRDVKFFYTYCSQIPKQRDFHRARKELFRDRVAYIKELMAPIHI